MKTANTFVINRLAMSPNLERNGCQFSNKKNLNTNYVTKRNCVHNTEGNGRGSTDPKSAQAAITKEIFQVSMHIFCGKSFFPTARLLGCVSYIMTRYSHERWCNIKGNHWIGVLEIRSMERDICPIAPLLEPQMVPSYWWSVDTKSLSRMVDEILFIFYLPILVEPNK